MSLLPRNTGKADVLLPWERRRNVFTSGALWGRPGILLGAVLALGALLFAAWRAGDEQARIRTTRTSIAEVKRAISAFRAEFGRCPHSMAELLHPPRVSVRYLEDVPRDGWNRPLYVRCPSTYDEHSAEVVSAGPSGSFSDGDNIY